MTSSNALGDFLRARRELLDPADFELPDGGPRRKAGLRRREVAFLAGVSAPYYARLEQGADRSPSASVLAALGRVLGLDTEAMVHLRHLGDPASRRPDRDGGDQVTLELVRLVADLADRAAVVINRYRDVLVANALAAALNPAFRPGTNLLRHAFLDPAASAVYPDWDDVATGGVAGLRAMNGDRLDDPRLIELVGELSVKSDAFRDMWARHDVRNRNDGSKRYRTRLAGIITVQYLSLTVNTTEGQTLFVFSAPSGTPDAEALRLLARETGSTGTVEPDHRAQRNPMCVVAESSVCGERAAGR